MNGTLRASGVGAQDGVTTRLEPALALACILPWVWLFAYYGLALRHHLVTGSWPAVWSGRFPWSAPPPGFVDPKHYGFHHGLLSLSLIAFLPLGPFVAAGFVILATAGLRVLRYAIPCALGAGLMVLEAYLDPFGFFAWFMD